MNMPIFNVVYAILGRFGSPCHYLGNMWMCTTIWNFYFLSLLKKFGSIDNYWSPAIIRSVNDLSISHSLMVKACEERWMFAKEGEGWL